MIRSLTIAVTVTIVAALVLNPIAADAKKHGSHLRPTFLGRRSVQTEAQRAVIEFPSPLVQDILPPDAATSATLSVFPAAIERLGFAIVSFDNVTVPNVGDYVTITCGVLDGNLTDYLDAVQVPQPLATSGSVRFDDLPDMYCAQWSFVYVSNASATAPAQALAATGVPSAVPLGTPQNSRVQLDLTDPTAAWITFASSDGASTPLVLFGAAPDALTLSAKGTSDTWTAADMCHAPATNVAQQWWLPPGFQHHVRLTGLDAWYGAPVYYVATFVEHPERRTPVRSFVHRPAPGVQPAGSATQFIFIADQGTDDAPAGASTAERLTDEVLLNGATLVLHNGDLSYGRGHVAIWQQWLAQNEPFSSRAFYQVQVGNHEADVIVNPTQSVVYNASWHPTWGNFGEDSHGECANVAYAVFKPTFDDATQLFTGGDRDAPKRMFYSFDYGHIHVVQLDSEHDWTVDSEQLTWLQNDLAAVDRAATPFIVVTAHRMAYTTQLEEDDDWEVSLRFRAALDPLFEKYGVHLMLSGHQHDSQRSAPVLYSQVITSGRGTVHYIAGSAGASLEDGDFSTVYGNFEVVNLKVFGYLRLTATQTALTGQFINNANGGIMDEFTLQPWLPDSMMTATA